ncbi:phosphoglycolate phosphatase [Paraferrimonas sedimenticola]|uniref:Phosphoglycolate phosphatase n=1 Tax=Paraferrimonas sedimenticola TaxID=375674 RepID=A0AA37RZ42_9GAMM|nr:phosphoglycolate phosphatase [Paraferrimonas sedimenticola]GLP97517.1 phosphoglycolate phosphatase [Paraferrimonas sedimenticola]
MSQYRAIGFDLDGTLVDSVPDIHAATNVALAGLGLDSVSEAQVRGWIGNGVPMLLTRALTAQTGEPPSEALLVQARGLFDPAYHADLCSHGSLYPNVAETLKQLQQQGYSMAVITNKPEAFVEPILTHFGIAQYFSLVIGGDTLAKAKPDPMPIEHCMARFGVSTVDFLMVGDSKNDILAAQAAGCASLGLTYGYNYGEDIALSNPTFVASDIQQIFDFIAQAE